MADNTDFNLKETIEKSNIDGLIIKGTTNNALKQILPKFSENNNDALNQTDSDSLKQMEININKRLESINNKLNNSELQPIPSSIVKVFEQLMESSIFSLDSLELYDAINKALEEEIKKPFYKNVNITSKENNESSLDPKLMELLDFIEVKDYYYKISKYKEKGLTPEKIAEKLLKYAYSAYKEKNSPITAAISMGAVIKFSENQTTITNKDFQFSLTTRKNNKAYIVPCKEGIWSIIESKNDSIGINSKISEYENTSFDIETLDLPLLYQIFTAMYDSSIQFDSNSVSVYWPYFCKSMGIKNNRLKNKNDLFEKIGKFKNCVGVISNSEYLKVIDILSFDENKNVVTFASPYINRLLGILAVKKEVSYKKQNNIYEIPNYSKDIKSTIVKERNKTAVEIVRYIVAGINQRGNIADSKLPQNRRHYFEPGTEKEISYSVSVQLLIKNIPILSQRLESSKSIRTKNQVLERSFKKVYELLKTQTTLYETYQDFKITEIIPKYSNLDVRITVAHKGKKHKKTDGAELKTDGAELKTDGSELKMDGSDYPNF